MIENELRFEKKCARSLLVEHENKALWLEEATDQ